MKRNIYLAGFMGTGKSTIGRELAKVMGRKFIDIDHLIENRLGKTVNQIFDEFGEDFFRQKEFETAKELSAESNRVVALGGGTLLNPEIHNLFATTGLIICLETRREDLVKRLERTDKRPILRGEKDTLSHRVEKVYEDRKHIFAEIPIRLDTTNLTPPEAAKKIVEILKMKIRILDRLHDQYIYIK